MEKVNVNNYQAHIYQGGEVVINIPQSKIDRCLDGEGLKVYLTIAELKELLRIAESESAFENE